jgi:hypothetical protein
MQEFGRGFLIKRNLPSKCFGFEGFSFLPRKSSNQNSRRAKNSRQQKIRQLLSAKKTPVAAHKKIVIPNEVRNLS